MSLVDCVNDVRFSEGPLKISGELVGTSGATPGTSLAKTRDRLNPQSREERKHP